MIVHQTIKSEQCALALGDEMNGNSDRKTCNVYSWFHVDLSSEASKYDKHSIS